MQGMESSHSQGDVGMRTIDYIDLNSEDESMHPPNLGGDAPNVDLLDRVASLTTKKNRKSSPTIEPLVTQCETRQPIPRDNGHGYQRLGHSPIRDHIQFAETPTTSFNGSVDELLHDIDRSSPLQSSYPAHESSKHTDCGSGYVSHGGLVDQQTPIPTSKLDQILGAHAIAHEITLQALMRDETTLDRSLHSFAPVHAGERNSLLPPALRLHDPRSPRARTFSTPTSSASKKVSVLPPPIDTSRPRRSLPPDLVRTPYPVTPERVHRKDYGRSPLPAGIRTSSISESVLTLGVRRSGSHRFPKVTSITIPAPNDFRAVRSDSIGEKERHFTAIEYDDEQFFRRLQASYSELSGPTRYFSARTLVRIAVSGPATKAADAGYGWLHQPRSPRALAYKGLKDTFSEEKILQHYRNPRFGRSRYAFVHWAHRLAAAPAVETPHAVENTPEIVDRDLTRKMEQPEGLEFVLGWSARRIVCAVLVVMSMSVVATLLWVFLGRSSIPSLDAGGGFRDAGDRVGTGLLLGMCSLFIGLSGIAGWLGISWLVT